VAWLSLAERYAPKMAVDKQVLFEELQASKLDDVAKDPEVWIMELLQIQPKLGEMLEFVSDGLLMCHILGNLPVEYKNVADNLANDSKKTVSSVTVSLKDKFERLKKSGKIGVNGETVLIGHKKFSGDCLYCGKKRHKAFYCYKKKDDDKHKIGGNKEKKGFKGTCHNCGKKGHKKADCYQLREKSGTEDKSAVVLVAAPWCMVTGTEKASEINITCVWTKWTSVPKIRYFGDSDL
jgi:hypothetical protein